MSTPPDEINGRDLVDQLDTAVDHMAKVQQASQDQARQLAEQRKVAQSAGGGPAPAA